MTPPLRPMNLGEILDRTFQIYRSRFWLFICIACMPVFAWELLYSITSSLFHVHAIDQPLRHFGTLLWNFILSQINFYAFFIFVFVSVSAAVKATSSSVLGTGFSATSSLRFAAVRWRRYTWIAFLVASACLVIVETESTIRWTVGWIVTDVASSVGRRLAWAIPTLATAATVTGWALMLWVFARISFSIPATAFENLRGIGSLQRSWKLTTKSWKNVWLTLAGLLAGLWISNWALEFLFGQVMYFLGDVLHIPDTMRNLYRPVTFVIGTTVYILLGPIYPIAITLFYYDQRIRREGYDIERLMESAGMTATLTPPAGEEVAVPAIAPAPFEVPPS